MEDLLIYLIKASALVGIFFLSYVLLLKKETSFELNRKFLFGGLLASAILPAVYFTRTVFVEAPATAVNFISSSTTTTVLEPEATMNWWTISGYFYLAITGFFMLRFLLQLISVLRIIIFHKKESREGFQFIKTKEAHLPFSFFNYIVYNPENHSKKDLRLILEHEKVHSRQVHSADILLANLAQSILWINPFAWFYKKTIEQNLEFIADRETVSNKAEIKEYQRALVKVSIAELRPALTNHFYQSFIKKRILMLNSKTPTHSPAWKISLITPIIFGFMLLFNVETEAQIIENDEPQTSQVKLQEKEVSITIDKETTKEALESMTNFLKERDIEIDLDNVSYNKGLLTSIIFNFLDKTTGNKGMMKRNDPKGIKPFKFYRKSNGEIGVGGIENEKVFTSSSGKNISSATSFSDLGPEPLYIINGKELKASRLKNKFIAIESEIEILDGSEAVKRFGKKAENGAVIIPEAHIIRDFNKRMKELDKQTTSFSGKYIMVGDQGKPNFLTVNTTKEPGKSINATFQNFSSKNKPLVIINGERVKSNNWKSETDPENVEQVYVLKNKQATKTYGKAGKNGAIIIETKDFEKSNAPAEYEFIKTDSRSFTFESAGDIPAVNMENSNVVIMSRNKPIYVLNDKIQGEDFIAKEIEPANIAKINVLKGDLAIEKYGEKAKDGVIQIFTKDYMGDTSSPVESNLFFVNSKYTDEALESMKTQMMEKLELDVNFSEIERNSEGLITSIKINAVSADNKKASATFKNSDGIPHILIGFTEKDNLVITSNKIK